jgi:hypothetical protein
MSSKNKKEKDHQSGKATLLSQFSLDFLEHVLLYVFSENLIVTKKSLRKVQKLFSSFKKKDFDGDREKEVRVFLINTAANGRLDKGLHPGALLFDYCSKLGKFQEEIEEIYTYLNEYEIANEEIFALDGMITSYLKYIKLADDVPKIQDLLMRFQVGDFEDIATFFEEEFEPTIFKTAMEIRGVKAASNISVNDFDLRVDSLKSVVDYTMRLRKTPGVNITTGIKRLNGMIGGKGSEPGRVYTILATPGKWKSGFLLNLALWAKKYNKDCECFDKTKKPAVLYLTLENDIMETVERIVSNKMGESIKDYPNGILDFETEELIANLLDEGLNDEGMNVFFKYRPTKTVDVFDIQDMISEMNDEGYEIKMIIIDYLKRMKPSIKESEERMRLGTIVDEVSAYLAKKYNIPVWLASQLNREAMKKLEESLEMGKGNLAQKVQTSHVGEAFAIIENSDYCLIGLPEELIAQNGDISRFYSMKRVKSRGKVYGGKEFEYFAHPFVHGNDMALQEDLLLKNSLSEDFLPDSFGAAGLDSPDSPRSTRKRVKKKEGEESNDVFHSDPKKKGKAIRKDSSRDSDILVRTQEDF